MAGDDEQGVVDPDAEADQHPEDRGEADNGEDVAQQAGEGVADANGDQSRHDRGDRREQCAERQAEHDQGEDHPEGGAVGRLLGLDVLDRLAGEGDRKVRPLGGLGGIDHRLDRIARKVLGLEVEADRREGDLPIPADLAGAARPVGAGHAHNVGKPADLGEHRLDLGAHRRRDDRPGPGLNHDLVGIARSAREVVPEDGEGLGRGAVGQGDIGGVVDPGGLAHGGEQDQREKPPNEDEPAVPEAPASETGHQRSPVPAVPVSATKAASSSSRTEERAR